MSVQNSSVTSFSEDLNLSANETKMLLLQKVTPPFRYGVVIPGLYRGSYPTLRNFRFLNRLGLTIVISLTPELPSADLINFCSLANIKLYHFSINRNSFLNSALVTQFVSIMMIILDEKRLFSHQFEKQSVSNEKLLQSFVEGSSTPECPSIYIHCLDGRRITSLIVLILRRLQGWSPTSSFSEYWSYQAVMRFPIQIAEIEKSSKDITKFVLDVTHSMRFPAGFILPLWVNPCYLNHKNFHQHQSIQTNNSQQQQQQQQQTDDGTTRNISHSSNMVASSSSVFSNASNIPSSKRHSIGGLSEQQQQQQQQLTQTQRIASSISQSLSSSDVSKLDYSLDAVNHVGSLPFTSTTATTATTATVLEGKISPTFYVPVSATPTTEVVSTDRKATFQSIKPSTAASHHNINNDSCLDYNQQQEQQQEQEHYLNVDKNGMKHYIDVAATMAMNSYDGSPVASRSRADSSQSNSYDKSNTGGSGSGSGSGNNTDSGSGSGNGSGSASSSGNSGSASGNSGSINPNLAPHVASRRQSRSGTNNDDDDNNNNNTNFNATTATSISNSNSSSNLAEANKSSSSSSSSSTYYPPRIERSDRQRGYSATTLAAFFRDQSPTSSAQSSRYVYEPTDLELNSSFRQFPSFNSNNSNNNNNNNNNSGGGGLEGNETSSFYGSSSSSNSNSSGIGRVGLETYPTYDGEDEDEFLNKLNRYRNNQQQQQQQQQQHNLFSLNNSNSSNSNHRNSGCINQDNDRSDISINLNDTSFSTSFFKASICDVSYSKLSSAATGTATATTGTGGAGTSGVVAVKSMTSEEMLDKLHPKSVTMSSEQPSATILVPVPSVRIGKNQGGRGVAFNTFSSSSSSSAVVDYDDTNGDDNGNDNGDYGFMSSTDGSSTNEPLLSLQPLQPLEELFPSSTYVLTSPIITTASYRNTSISMSSPTSADYHSTTEGGVSADRGSSSSQGQLHSRSQYGPIISPVATVANNDQKDDEKGNDNDNARHLSQQWLRPSSHNTLVITGKSSGSRPSSVSLEQSAAAAAGGGAVITSFVTVTLPSADNINNCGANMPLRVAVTAADSSSSAAAAAVAITTTTISTTPTSKQSRRRNSYCFEPGPDIDFSSNNPSSSSSSSSSSSCYNTNDVMSKSFISTAAVTAEGGGGGGGGGVTFATTTATAAAAPPRSSEVETKRWRSASRSKSIVISKGSFGNISAATHLLTQGLDALDLATHCDINSLSTASTAAGWLGRS